MELVKKIVMALALLASLVAVSGCGSKDVTGDDSGSDKHRNELSK
jgi:hypothetical protein